MKRKTIDRLVRAGWAIAQMDCSAVRAIKLLKTALVEDPGYADDIKRLRRFRRRIGGMCEDLDAKTIAHKVMHERRKK